MTNAQVENLIERVDSTGDLLELQHESIVALALALIKIIRELRKKDK